MTAQQLLRIPASQIDRFLGQPRTEFPDEGLNALARSIELDGQVTPIMVTPTNNGRYLLLDGERRWRAAKSISDDFELEAVIAHEITDERMRYLQSLVANAHREGLSVLDTARAMRNVCDNYGGMEAVSRIFGVKTPSTILGYLSLLLLPQEVQQFLGSAYPVETRMPRTIGVELARVSDPVLQLSLAKEIMNQRLGTSAARHLITRRALERGVPVKGRRKKRPSDHKLLLADALDRQAKILQRYVEILRSIKSTLTSDDLLKLGQLVEKNIGLLQKLITP